MTTTRKTSKRTTADRRAARETADRSARRVGKMTPVERMKLVQETLDDSAPTTEAAASDLLAALQAIGTEFVRRYYPTSTWLQFVWFSLRGGLMEVVKE